MDISKNEFNNSYEMNLNEECILSSYYNYLKKNDIELIQKKRRKRIRNEY